MDRQLIEEYVACGPRLRAAVAGLTREDLTARPGPGKWSILGGKLGNWNGKLATLRELVTLYGTPYREIT
jgi:hypothetical protein